MHPPARRLGAFLSLSLHALAGAALLSYEPARSALIAAAPLMVELITPPSPQTRPEPVREVPPPPRARPPVAPQPRALEPLPIAAESPAPAVAAEPPATAPVAIAAALPLQLPLTPPLFSADYLNNPPPEYPPLSRRFGEEGLVTLQVLVSDAGAPEEVQLLRSSGHPRLDRAALDAVKRWKFVPARRGSQTVAALAQIPIRFRQKD